MLSSTLWPILSLHQTLGGVFFLIHFTIIKILLTNLKTITKSRNNEEEFTFLTINEKADFKYIVTVHYHSRGSMKLNARILFLVHMVYL
jgi:hypothetical protein